jgi:hypothetical protein
MFQQNEMVDINQLVALNDQLRKNADAIKKSAVSVGYQSNSVGSGSLSPIVPQSIEQTLANASFAMKDIVLWNLIPKVAVTNTYHEYAVINEHGQDLDPFISEGGGEASAFGTTNAQYERKFVKIKYMAERRQISDVGTLVGILGSNPNGLAEEIERGTMSLLRKVESQLFHGSELLNSNGFDGIIDQIARDTATGWSDAAGGRTFSNNQSDLAGTTLTPGYLHQVLGELSGLERFGKSDFIMCDPKVYSDLIKASNDFGRHDSLMLVNMLDQGVQTFGAGPKIHIMGPFGPVPVIMAPFLNKQSSPPSAGSADGLALTAGAAFVLGVENDAASKFDSAAGDHKGTFKYKLVAVNDKGYSNAIDCGAGVALQNGKVAKITINAAGQTQLALGTANSAKYLKLYRSAPDVDADYKLVLELPVSALATSGADKVAFDYGTVRRESASVIVGQADSMEFARLLDFLVRPVADLGAAKNLLLMLFGAASVKTPKKNWVIRNVGAKITL